MPLPGAAGNILTSDGTEWKSLVPSPVIVGPLQWTPIITTDQGGTATHQTQQGWYYKIGRVCFLEFYVALSSKGSLPAAGMVQLANFPVQAYFYGAGVLSSCQNFTLGAGTWANMVLSHGAGLAANFSYAVVQANPVYFANLQAVNIADNFLAVGSIWYITAN